MYSLGTLIPALYYATISAMLAVMTSMGCIFFRDEISEARRKERELCCVRAESGWYVMKRTAYASSVLRVGTGDWHQMVVNFYGFFVREGYQVPHISLEEMAKFRKERDDAHYRVLSETTVTKTTDLSLYFERLLFATQFVGAAISHVGGIQRDRKGYTERFDQLVAAYENLFREYADEFSFGDLLSQLPGVAGQQKLDQH